MAGIRAEVPNRTASLWARSFSLAVAGAISLALMLDPFVLRGFPLDRIHEGLPIMLLGVAGSFVHGFGFRPTNRMMKGLAHPALSWILLGLGAALIAAR
jgi:predicted membrane protein